MRRFPSWLTIAGSRWSKNSDSTRSNAATRVISSFVSSKSKMSMFSRMRYASRQRRLQSREDFDAVIADPEAVLAGGDFSAPQLQHPQPAPIDGTARLVLELQDAVRDRELRLRASLRRGVLADQNQDRVAVRDLAREVIERAAELIRRRDIVQRLAAVDDDDRRLRLEPLPQDLVRDARESVGSIIADQFSKMQKLDALSERIDVEERKRFEMAHHLVVRHRPGRVIERLPLTGRVRETDLLGGRRASVGRAVSERTRPLPFCSLIPGSS